MKFPMFSKENKPHMESISEIIDSEISAYLNASQGFFLKMLW